MNIVFFGSFQHYSALILKSLIMNHKSIQVIGVVTSPPAPMGRKKILTKNPVHQMAESHNIPVFTPEKLDAVILKSYEKVDFFVTAGYGKFLPKSWLDYPKHGSLNLHFSLLPKYRGANPAEWAILLGETKTGITLMHMNEKLDGGDILAQEETLITDTDTRETLYEKLYTRGAEKLPDWLVNLPEACSAQPKASPVPPAKRFTREQAFIDWRILTAVMQGKTYDVKLLPKNLLVAFNFLNANKPRTSYFEQCTFIERAIRALAGFPGVWTLVNTSKGQKRMKILTSYLVPRTSHLQLATIQLEGYTPTSFKQIKNQII
jgi:methionyl-tRNA formyltransferase